MTDLFVFRNVWSGEKRSTRTVGNVPWQQAEITWQTQPRRRRSFNESEHDTSELQLAQESAHLPNSADGRELVFGDKKSLARRGA